MKCRVIRGWGRCRRRLRGVFFSALVSLSVNLSLCLNLGLGRESIVLGLKSLPYHQTTLER